MIVPEFLATPVARFTSTTVLSAINAIPAEPSAASLTFFLRVIVPAFSYVALAPVFPANFIP